MDMWCFLSLQVDSCEKLSSLLEDDLLTTTTRPALNDNDIAAGRALDTQDYNCVLVEVSI